MAGAGITFRWSQSPTPTGISSASGLGMALSTFAPDHSGKDVVEYLRGSNGNELLLYAAEAADSVRQRTRHDAPGLVHKGARRIVAR